MRSIRKWCVLLALVVCPACDSSDTCDDGALACDGDMIVSCKDGDWLALQDCAAEDMVCHAMDDDTHCLPESELEDSGTDAAMRSSSPR